MKKQFLFEFEESQPNSLGYECSLEENERLDTLVEEGGVPILYLNRPAMVTLAKLLIRMSQGSFAEQFHVHIHKHFNADEPQRLTIMLFPDDVKPG